MNNRRATDSTLHRTARATEIVVLLASLVGGAFGMYFFLDSKHAQRDEALMTEIELRQEILDRDIKKNAEARVYYKDKARLAPLDAADASRLEYLEEQLEHKYEEQRMLQQKEMELTR